VSSTIFSSLVPAGT